MDLEFFYSPDAPYVKIYSLEHILFLLFCAAAIFLFVRFRKAIARNRVPVGNIMLGIILFQQIFLMYGWYAVTGQDMLKVGLPLELCRVSTLLTIVFLLCKDRRIMDVIFYFSIFALASLFYPKNVYHFTHVNGVSYMINHLMTVLTPIFGVIAYGWRPSWKGCLRAGICFTVYLPVVILVNHFTGGNYFYLVDRPFFGGLAPWLFDIIAYGGTIAGFCLVTLALQPLSRQKVTV